MLIRVREYDFVELMKIYAKLKARNGICLFFFQIISTELWVIDDKCLLSKCNLNNMTYTRCTLTKYYIYEVKYYNLTKVKILFTILSNNF